MSGASRVRPFFGGVNVRVFALNCSTTDAGPVEIDIRAAERIKLARTKTRERGDLKPGRK